MAHVPWHICYPQKVVTYVEHINDSSYVGSKALVVVVITFLQIPVQYIHSFNVFSLTVLSRPSVINMTKKMIAQNVEPFSVARASGYTTNTNPAPMKMKCNIDYIHCQELLSSLLRFSDTVMRRA